MRNVIAALIVAGAVAAPAAIAAPRVSSIVKVSASPSGLKYNTKTLRAKAGRIELVFNNPSMLRHNVRLEVGEKEFGGTKTVAHATTKAFVTLKAGVYHFYCSVPGHEDAGMSGKLIVS